jgi:hypothetical protein
MTKAERLTLESLILLMEAAQGLIWGGPNSEAAKRIEDELAEKIGDVGDALEEAE